MNPFPSRPATRSSTLPHVFHARVVDRSAVVGVRSDFAIDVVVAERDIVPARGMEDPQVWRDFDSSPIAGRANRPGSAPSISPCKHEEVEASVGIGLQLRYFDTMYVRHRRGSRGRARETTARRTSRSTTWSPELREAAGRMPPVSVDRGESWLPATSTIIGVRQRLHQPRELHERVQDRLIGRAHGVEHVARDDARRRATARSSRSIAVRNVAATSASR